MNKLSLGINIDHIATLRQVRGTLYPNPVQAVMIAEEAGADGITLHMREDLRHIQARDVYLIKDIIQTRMNLEMAVTDAMLNFAEKIKPQHVCLVPEKREELTTEGGLDVIANNKKIAEAIIELKKINSEVSLFIDADLKQIDAALALGADAIEIHTGHYANAKSTSEQNIELTRIIQAVKYATDLKLIVNAGHGLNYTNVQPIAAIQELNELNIGHAIIARAVFSGLHNAIKDMHQLLHKARLLSALIL